jgi:integrase/recombinase XerD
VKERRPGLSLAVVRDLRVAAAFETDELVGFVLARAAGITDSTIASDVRHLEQVRAWFGRPLWQMQPVDADLYFGKVLRDAASGSQVGWPAGVVS